MKLEVGQMSAVSLPKTAWTTLTMIMTITMMKIVEWICLKIAKHLDLLFGLAGYLHSFKFTGLRINGFIFIRDLAFATWFMLIWHLFPQKRFPIKKKISDFLILPT